ncbi:MAG: TolB family protein [Planctomycetota bacterium]|jgi:hypothetical protein
MLWNKQTKRSLAILLMITVVVGLTMTAWAKKPDNPGGGKPGGGGGDPVDTGTIYYAHESSLWSMNPDGSGKTLLPVGGAASMTRHPAEADRWFLQLQTIPSEFYPITTFPPEYWWQMSGLDDLEAVGFTGDPDPNLAWGTIIYYIEIDGEGNPDTFSWYANSSLLWGGDTPKVVGVPITGGDQKLVYGSTELTIQFESTTGHTAGDPFGDWWGIYVKKTQRRELFTVREDGQIEVQLTDDSDVQPWMPGDPSRALPSWATHDGVADGKISYLAQRWGKDVVLERGLFAVEIEWIDGTPYATTEPTRLPVTLPMDLDSLEVPYDWSPDGTWIVYSAGGVWVVDAYGNGAGEWLCDGWTPRWSPELDDVGSTLIAFRVGSWGEAEIRTISPGGGPETTIVALGKNRTIWGGMDWSPNGTHLIYTRIHSKACSACQYNDSYDVYRVGADGSDPTNLTKDLQEEAFSMGWRD